MLNRIKRDDFIRDILVYLNSSRRFIYFNNF